MKSEEAFFVVYSNSSRNASGGLRPKIMLRRESEIIAAAGDELNRSGGTFEEIAGVSFVEDSNGDLQPERDIKSEEFFKLSVEKLSDDGRLFAAFPTNEEGANAFINEAARYGLEDSARALVQDLN